MSGDNSTTTQTSSEPLAESRPLIKQGMGDALKQYGNGGLVKVNEMSTVVPYAQQTMQGINSIQQNANDALAPGGFASQFRDIIGNGGFNQPQMDAMDQIRGTATGAYDMNANPGFQGVLDQALEKSMSGVNANAAAMGRYGSGTHQGVMQQEQGNLASRMINDDYNRFLGRKDAATRDMFGMGQTGMDNMNPAFASMNAPAQDLMGVGGMFEDLMGRQLNDQLRITQEKQNLPAANIERLLALAAGAGKLGGTATSTSQMPSSFGSNIAGGLLGGASLIGGL